MNKSGEFARSLGRNVGAQNLQENIHPGTHHGASFQRQMVTRGKSIRQEAARYFRVSVAATRGRHFVPAYKAGVVVESAPTSWRGQVGQWAPNAASDTQLTNLRRQQSGELRFFPQRTRMEEKTRRAFAAAVSAGFRAPSEAPGALAEKRRGKSINCGGRTTKPPETTS